MEFNYSEELLEIKRIVREFAEKEIRPHVQEWDEKQIFPRDVLKKLAELGFMGVLIPHEYGGAGLGYLEYVTIVEELSRVDGSVGISVAAHNSLCTGHIYSFGNEEQRRKFVVPLAKGEKLGAWSLTESEAGSDAAGTQTVAQLEGEHWILNGQKTFTTHGTYGDICVAMALTDKSAGHRGISAFILERGMPGFSPGKKENKLGRSEEHTSELQSRGHLVCRLLLEKKKKKKYCIYKKKIQKGSTIASKNERHELIADLGYLPDAYS